MIARRLCLLFVLLAASPAAADDFFIRPTDRTILFLGDSITQAGGYVTHIDAYLLATFPDRHHNVIRLGLGSETVSGLTEPDHPFPRPDLHERLSRALDLIEPDLVIACYGMNDGIYHPYSDERFRAYQEGINRLIDKVKAAGARLVLMSPTPFDPRPIGDKTVGADAPEFGYKHPYRHYDDVLNLYGAWVIAQRHRVDGVVDLHTALTHHVAHQRETDPDFILARDGVHPGGFGHFLMARVILKSWNAPSLDAMTWTGVAPDFASVRETADFWDLVTQRQVVSGAAWTEHVGHQRPGKLKTPPLEEVRPGLKRIDRKIRAMLSYTR